MFLDHKRKIIKLSERRKSPINYRLKYGIEVLLSNIKENQQNPTKNILKNSLSHELSGYKFISKDTKEVMPIYRAVSIIDDLDNTLLTNLDVFLNVFVEEVLSRFNVYSLYSLK